MRFDCYFEFHPVYYVLMKKWKIGLLAIWILVISIPLVVGIIKSDENLIFGGLIFNPIDGYSYLAKMQEGYAGEWTFQLPYSSQENGEVFIFTLYIFLGHIARLVGIGIPEIFNLFRIGISILFFFSVDSLLTRFFEKEDYIYKFTFGSIIFGGGLGWIYFVFGTLPIDFWVSEAFIFLSSLSNPHFILSFLIISILINFIIRGESNLKIFAVFFVLSCFLTNISPFASINIGFLLIISFFYDRFNSKNTIKNLIAFSLPAILISSYQFFTIKNDPILSIWNAQNQTPTPEVANILFGFSPFLLGIIILLALNYRKKITTILPIKILLAWILITLILANIPLNLQRRFLVGLYLPLGIVFWKLFSLHIKIGEVKTQRFLPTAILGISLISNLLIYSGGVNALINQDQMFFIDKEIKMVTNWMKTNDLGQSTILANEENGLVIPALGEFRVVYGHPFESINAIETKERVNKFWQNDMSEQEQIDFINKNNVEFVLCEIEDKIPECPKVTKKYLLKYESAKIKLFQVVN